MHHDELDIDASLVRRLLASQFPRWAELPIERIEPTGTDNAIYRLGEDMVVRLPRVARTVATLEKERAWLPRLAPHLPLAVPVPLAEGTPTAGYPWVWSVYRWLEGTDATVEPIADLGRAASDLARVIAALQSIDATGGPLRERTTSSAARRSSRETTRYARRSRLCTTRSTSKP
jgi:aminoglycoside phosphotransferase (APT) family kinase protein